MWKTPGFPHSFPRALLPLPCSPAGCHLPTHPLPKYHFRIYRPYLPGYHCRYRIRPLRPPGCHCRCRIYRLHPPGCHCRCRTRHPRKPLPHRQPDGSPQAGFQADSAIKFLSINGLTPSLCSFSFLSSFSFICFFSITYSAPFFHLSRIL